MLCATSPETLSSEITVYVCMPEGMGRAKVHMALNQSPYLPHLTPRSPNRCTPMSAYTTAAVVCACVVTTSSRRLAITTWCSCQFFSWSAEQRKWIFPCPRSRQRVCSRELHLAFLSRVSPPILHTQAVLVLITELLYPFPLSAMVLIRTVMRHWTSPEFIRYRWRSLPPRTRRYKANVL